MMTVSFVAAVALVALLAARSRTLMSDPDERAGALTLVGLGTAGFGALGIHALTFGSWTVLVLCASGVTCLVWTLVPALQHGWRPWERIAAPTTNHSAPDHVERAA